MNAPTSGAEFKVKIVGDLGIRIRKYATATGISNTAAARALIARALDQADVRRVTDVSDDD